MENFLYQCQYCGKEYKPNRRHKQRFCSNSCRTNSHIRNKKLKLAVNDNKLESNKPTQSQSMSWSGVGNAAVGSFIANKVNNLTTRPENKAVTKKEINELITALKGRYFPIKNAPFRADGAKPFYDILTQTYVYFKN